MDGLVVPTQGRGAGPTTQPIPMSHERSSVVARDMTTGDSRDRGYLATAGAQNAGMYIHPLGAAARSEATELTPWPMSPATVG